MRASAGRHWTLLRNRKMLSEGGNTPAAVARRLGYPSVQYFSLVFKKATGVAPNEYAGVIRRLDGSASRIAGIFININAEKKEIMQAQKSAAFHRAFTKADLWRAGHRTYSSRPNLRGSRGRVRNSHPGAGRRA